MILSLFVNRQILTMLDVPIALVIFNRPESVRRSFARIRAAQPSKLFVISDAARPDCEGEEELVAQSREIAQQVDWPCQVRKIYATENLGCDRRIASGITEAFDEVDRLIVIEDDCVADSSFFGYCQELLQKYQHDQRVMAVSGNNFQQGIRRTESSYYFSKYPHCWGWATWRRAWQHFDLQMTGWPQFRDQGHLASVCSSKAEVEYWIKMLDRVYNGQVKSWAYPWTLACWMQHGLTALPEVNLVSNIGFGITATHTNDRQQETADLQVESLGEIVHPQWVFRHVEADAYTDETVFRPNRRRLISRVSRTFPKIYRAA